MKFRNVKLPEGINVSRHNPFADLAILSAGLLAGFAVLVVVVLLLGEIAGRYMPMSWENAIADAVIGDAIPPSGGVDAGPPDEAAAAIERELQALADRLAARMDLPEDTRLAVHYVDDDPVNAFVTLGGNVFVFRGLLERMPSENALAMVLAHEIGHIVNRDPAAGLAGAVMLQLAYSIAFESAPDALQALLYGENMLLLRSFSRDAERDADYLALAAVAGEYGHVAGASALFEVFLAAGADDGEPPEFLSTHPLSRGRIDALASMAADEGWPAEGATTPLPPAIAALGDGG